MALFELGCFGLGLGADVEEGVARRAVVVSVPQFVHQPALASQELPPAVIARTREVVMRLFVRRDRLRVAVAATSMVV